MYNSRLILNGLIQKLNHIKTNKILGDSVSVLFERTTRFLFGFLITFWSARIFGSEMLGVYNYVSAFLALFLPAASLGVDVLAVKYFVERSSKVSELLSTFLSLRLFATIFISLVAFGIFSVTRIDAEASITLMVILIVSALIQCGDVFDFLLISRNEMQTLSVVRLISFGFGTVTRCFILLFNPNIILFAACFLIENLVSFVMTLTALNRIKLLDFSFPRFSIARRIVLECWPFLVCSISTAIYTRLSNIQLGQLLGTAATGQFAISTKIAESGYIVPMALSTVALPIMMKKSVSENQDDFELSAQKYFTLMSAVGLILSIMIAITSPFVIFFCLAPEFHEAIAATVILAFSNLTVALGIARTAYLVSKNLQRYYMYSLLVTAIAAPLLNFFFIRLFGITGAAIAVLISSWFASHGSCFVFKTLRGLGRILLFAVLSPYAGISQAITLLRKRSS